MSVGIGIVAGGLTDATINGAISGYSSDNFWVGLGVGAVSGFISAGLASSGILLPELALLKRRGNARRGYRIDENSLLRLRNLGVGHENRLTGILVVEDVQNMHVGDIFMDNIQAEGSVVAHLLYAHKFDWARGFSIKKNADGTLYPSGRSESLNSMDPNSQTSIGGVTRMMISSEHMEGISMALIDEGYTIKLPRTEGGDGTRLNNNRMYSNIKSLQNPFRGS